MCCKDIQNNLNLILLRLPDCNSIEYSDGCVLLVGIVSTCPNGTSAYGHALEFEKLGKNIAQVNASSVQKAKEWIRARAKILENPTN